VEVQGAFSKRKIGRFIANCAVTALVLHLASCGGVKDSPPDANTSPSPPSTPSQPGETPIPSEGLWVSFDHSSGEEFKAVITQKESVRYVLKYLEGEEQRKIPSGVVVKNGEFNSPWSWHLVPDSVVFADFTIELCDGTPSYLESVLDVWILDVRRYCPWGARIKSARDCRTGICTAEIQAPAR
jgi:hypothetical protein